MTEQPSTFFTLLIVPMMLTFGCDSKSEGRQTVSGTSPEKSEIASRSNETTDTTEPVGDEQTGDTDSSGLPSAPKPIPTGFTCGENEIKIREDDGPIQTFRSLPFPTVSSEKSLLSMIALFSLTTFALGAGNQVLPVNFRDWTHTKSMVISDKSHGLYGFHHIYANDKALKTSKKGTGTYVDGAQFVASFYEVETQGAMTSQGAKIMDVSMRKDSKGAAATGGWYYEAFDAAGKPKKIDTMKDCHSCHQGVAATDFVFSTYIP